jgi:hypothetical protein
VRHQAFLTAESRGEFPFLHLGVRIFMPGA